jgi:hypothetical protein
MPLKRSVVVALLLLAAAAGAWVAYGAQQTRAQARDIAALVEQGTGQLVQALQSTPSSADVQSAQRTADALGSARTSRQRAMAHAAGEYLAATRVLIQRRAELAGLERQAAASRQGLAAHMGAAVRRDAGWIHRATELKKKADQDQNDLERVRGAIVELLQSMDTSEAALAPHVQPSQLLGAVRREAALAQARR